MSFYSSRAARSSPERRFGTTVAFIASGMNKREDGMFDQKTNRQTASATKRFLERNPQ
jgi:hypothetical protein